MESNYLYFLSLVSVLTQLTTTGIMQDWVAIIKESLKNGQMIYLGFAIAVAGFKNMIHSYETTIET